MVGGESENLSVGPPASALGVDFTYGGNSAQPGFNPLRVICSYMLSAARYMK